MTGENRQGMERFVRVLVQLPFVIAAPFIFGAWPTVIGGLAAFALAVAGLVLGRVVASRFSGGGPQD